MKMFKLGNEVFAFEDDGSQDSWITPEMVPMTKEEIDKHLFPEKYMKPEELRAIYLASLKPLTRRQFKLVLLENGLLDKISETIAKITDETLRMQIQIEYEDSITFERDNPSLIQLYKLLGLKESQVDRMWEQALKL